MLSPMNDVIKLNESRNGTAVFAMCLACATALDASYGANPNKNAPSRLCRTTVHYIIVYMRVCVDVCVGARA